MLKVPLRVVKVPEAEVLKSGGYYGDEREKKGPSHKQGDDKKILSASRIFLSSHLLILPRSASHPAAAIDPLCQCLQRVLERKLADMKGRAKHEIN